MKKLIAAILVLTATAGAEPAGDLLELKSAESEFLWMEPVIVTVRVESEKIAALPPEPGAKLRFEIEPAVKARANAKPLALESKGADLAVQIRRYDLFEWFDFPQKGGTFKVKAVLEDGGRTIASEPVTFTTRMPGKDDPDQPAMARLHHPPYSNYETDKFCGDTFDLVEKWPASRLAKYSHYWNGRYSQNQKEYEKAIQSFRTVVEKYPDFVLAEDARYGIIECLVELKRADEARKEIASLLEKACERAEKAGFCCEKGNQTAAQRLARALAERL